MDRLRQDPYLIHRNLKKERKANTHIIMQVTEPEVPDPKEFDWSHPLHIIVNIKNMFVIRVQYINGPQHIACSVYRHGKKPPDFLSPEKKERSGLLPKDTPLDIKEFYRALRTKASDMNREHQAMQKWNRFRIGIAVLACFVFLFLIVHSFSQTEGTDILPVIPFIMIIVYFFIANQEGKKMFNSMINDGRSIRIQLQKKYENFPIKVIHYDQEKKILHY